MPILSANPLPIIDLGRLNNAGSAALPDIANVIDAACLSTGLFYIINHGISGNLQRRVLDETRALFDLPACDKHAMNINGNNHMRGYFGYGADKSDGVIGDLKEGFDLGPDLSPTDKLVMANLPFHGPNIWPQGLPGFKRNLTTYYDSMLTLGLNLLRAFSIGLGVSENYLGNHFQQSIAQLRLLRYPPGKSQNTVGIGAGEHTDFGCLTVILQDEIQGLEFKDPAGDWVCVPPVDGALVVNIGDLMQRWTNDAYMATAHRVINHASTTRHSVAFFMDPGYHATVACLPSCVSSARPPRYTPIIFGDYLTERYRQTTSFYGKQLAA